MAKRVLHDEYFQRAKAEGYVARSAYKLIEVQERRPIVRRGDFVLDLGCAPGSWLQVASKLVGKSGRVMGVDLSRVDREVRAKNVRTEVGDVFKVGANVMVGWNIGERYHAVLSDMAPATSGSQSMDHFRSVELCRRVLAVCPAVLRPGGNMVMKVFEGEAYMELLDETRRLFVDVKGLKPKATRDVSREMVVIARGMKESKLVGDDVGVGGAGDGA